MTTKLSTSTCALVLTLLVTILDLFVQLTWGFSPRCSRGGCNSRILNRSGGRLAFGCDEVTQVFPNMALPASRETGEQSRSDFIFGGAALLLSTAGAVCPPVLAFDGGVGGLGKTRPETGVVFRDSDTLLLPSDGGSDLFNELIGPDGSIVLIRFQAPWPMLRSSSSIESRDLANPEAAFLLVAPSPKKGGDELTTEFFREAVFGSKGKYGMYGSPTDIKVRKVASEGSRDPSSPAMYSVTFTTLTPAMRESDRKAYIASRQVGGGVFMLVAGTTAARFGKNESVLRDVVESFRAARAPERT